MADGSIVIDTELNTSAFKKGVSGLSKIATAGLAAATGAVAGFEAAMSKVQATSGASAEDIALLEAKAKKMGATTKFSATESAEALQYMAMAGWKTQDMLGGIEGIMNSGGGLW